jgi:hypothetical protein
MKFPVGEVDEPVFPLKFGKPVQAGGRAGKHQFSEFPQLGLEGRACHEIRIERGNVAFQQPLGPRIRDPGRINPKPPWCVLRRGVGQDRLQQGDRGVRFLGCLALDEVSGHRAHAEALESWLDQDARSSRPTGQDLPVCHDEEAECAPTPRVDLVAAGGVRDVRRSCASGSVPRMSDSPSYPKRRASGWIRGVNAANTSSVASWKIRLFVLGDDLQRGRARRRPRIPARRRLHALLTVPTMLTDICRAASGRYGRRVRLGPVDGFRRQPSS